MVALYVTTLPLATLPLANLARGYLARGYLARGYLARGYLARGGIAPVRIARGERREPAYVLAMLTTSGLLTIERNSRRVDGSLRNAPSMREVTIVAPALCTPRVDMH
jgi:hypothetical protein